MKENIPSKSTRSFLWFAVGLSTRLLIIEFKSIVCWTAAQD